MGVHGWDLGELVYSIVAILFWSGGILAVPVLYIWLRIWEAREARSCVMTIPIRRALHTAMQPRGIGNRALIPARLTSRVK